MPYGLILDLLPLWVLAVPLALFTGRALADFVDSIAEFRDELRNELPDELPRR